jgi:hypothetical protein
VALPIIGAIAAGTSIASKIAGHLAQRKEAERQELAANRAFLDTLLTLNQRLAEEQMASRRQIEEGQRALTGIKSRALASAAEAGVSGISVQLLEGDLARQGAEFAASIRENLEMVRRQIGREVRGAELRRESRIAEVPGPSLVGTALSIASAGAGAYTTFRARRGQ